ncbi:MAG: iron ABC transporter permease [Pseudomonadota bacterium]
MRASLITLVALCLLMALSVGTGSTQISAWESFAALLDPAHPQHMIVSQLRLPRALLAAGVGAALAASGLILQTVVRNALADPGILGLNAGAILAVVVLILIFPALSTRGGVALAAVIGAAAAMLAVFAIAREGGRAPIKLVLAGIAVSAIAGALITMLSLQSQTQSVQRALRWSSGSLNGTTWGEALTVWTSLLGLLPVLFVAHRMLDTLGFDQQSAAGLGVAVPRARVGFVVLAVLFSAMATAAAGIIAFVGLAAPHMARFLAGHRVLAYGPLALLLGAVICLGADLIGRSIFAPTQIPAGIVCAILGAPYFFWLMWMGDHG